MLALGVSTLPVCYAMMTKTTATTTTTSSRGVSEIKQNIRAKVKVKLNLTFCCTYRSRAHANRSLVRLSRVKALFVPVDKSHRQRTVSLLLVCSVRRLLLLVGFRFAHEVGSGSYATWYADNRLRNCCHVRCRDIVFSVVPISPASIITAKG